MEAGTGTRTAAAAADQTSRSRTISPATGARTEGPPRRIPTLPTGGTTSKERKQPPPSPSTLLHPTFLSFFIARLSPFPKAADCEFRGNFPTFPKASVVSFLAENLPPIFLQRIPFQRIPTKLTKISWIHEHFRRKLAEKIRGYLLHFRGNFRKCH